MTITLDSLVAESVLEWHPDYYISLGSPQFATDPSAAHMMELAMSDTLTDAYIQALLLTVRPAARRIGPREWQLTNTDLLALMHATPEQRARAALAAAMGAEE